MSGGITRRRLLRRGAAAGAALTGAAAIPELIEALAAAPRNGRLADIEHIVILIQENRSFDHYFGTLRGVRGFDDPNAIRRPDGGSIFAQPGFERKGYGGHLLPFRLDTYNGGDCVNDIDHGWGAQHRVWNGGRMDSWVREHLKRDGPENGPLTMGYYTRRDLPFYHALADAFTICDRYFCSVIGPTDPNRLYTLTASLDPDGDDGGPHLDTLAATRPNKAFKYTWPTMPERLTEHGIEWKVYSPTDSHLDDNVLIYFKRFQDPSLAARAFSPSFPGTFDSDVAAGTLPPVSWVLTTALDTEHPPAPVTYGERGVYECLSTLVSNPDVWAKTALIVTWDENGGFFDHVPPPVAPPGTPQEYLTVRQLPPEAEGVRGPIGLGFRVPALVVSPFARGGFVCSDVFDHTSPLRLIERRFGVPVPNLSSWRRAATGDMTGAFNLVDPPNKSVPALPVPSRSDQRVLASDCPTQASGELGNEFPTPVKPYPVPKNHTPHQERGRARRAKGYGRPKPRRTIRDQRYRRRRRRRHHRHRHRHGG